MTPASGESATRRETTSSEAHAGERFGLHPAPLNVNGTHSVEDHLHAKALLERGFQGNALADRGPEIACHALECLLGADGVATSALAQLSIRRSRLTTTTGSSGACDTAKTPNGCRASHRRRGHPARSHRRARGGSHDDPHRAAAAIQFAAQRLSGAGGEPLRRPRSGQRVERVVQTDTGRCRSQRGRDIHSG